MPLIIKNRQRETQLFKMRLWIAVSGVIVLLFFLIIRLIMLQWIQYSRYSTLSKNNAIEVIPIPPRRGIIYDRNGVILARNIPVFSLMVTPSKIKSLEELFIQVQAILPLTLSEKEQFSRQYTQHRRFEEIPLKLQLTDEEVARFSVNQFKCPGVSIKAQLMREYPLRQSFAHVVGYVARINQTELSRLDKTNYAATHFVGKVGIESYFEKELHGIVGYKRVETEASGRIIRMLEEIPPQCGKDLYLTIDSHLQIAAEHALNQNRGAIVAIKPSTGEILAFASHPAYDPNWFVQGVSHQEYGSLKKNSAHPLYNRALNGLYAPGSTIKPFIALAGLNHSLINARTKIYDPGWYKIPQSKHIYHDWLHTGHHWVDLRKAIVQSCDTYFYDLAYRLGIDKINEILNQFGLGQKMEIEMTPEVSTHLPTPEWKLKNRHEKWYAGDTVVVGIGQGYLQVTPLQLVVATSILANRGLIFKPRLLAATRQMNEEIQYESSMPRSSLILKDFQYWNQVIEAMSRVVTEGTGFRFGKIKYSVAAKTGTAQVINMQAHPFHSNPIPEKFRDNSVFIAFAPVEGPEIAIAVVVENNNEAPLIARKVLDFYFKNK